MEGKTADSEGVGGIVRLEAAEKFGREGDRGTREVNRGGFDQKECPWRGRVKNGSTGSNPRGKTSTSKTPSKRTRNNRKE